MKFPNPAELTRIRKEHADQETLEGKFKVVLEKHNKLPLNCIEYAKSVFNDLPDLLRKEAVSKWYAKIEIPNLETGVVIKDMIEACGIVGYKIQIADEQDKKTLRIMW